jgi:hypothetical protein
MVSPDDEVAAVTTEIQKLFWDLKLNFHNLIFFLFICHLK